MNGALPMTAISSRPLAGRRAMVTGGSRDIDAAIVRRRAANSAHVAFTFTSLTAAAEGLCAEVSESGGMAVAITADSADSTEGGNAVEYSVTALGELDILVNNVSTGHINPIDSYPQQVVGAQQNVHRLVRMKVHCLAAHSG